MGRADAAHRNAAVICFPTRGPSALEQHPLTQQGRVERAPKACCRLARNGMHNTTAPPALRHGNEQHDAFPEAFLAERLGVGGNGNR